jgi:AraC-like DNA-binding protein
MFGSQGLDVAALCDTVGIRRTSLADPSYRCDTDTVSQLWQLAIDDSRNPDLALATPFVAQPANFEAVGYAMMSCATLRTAIERLIRYLRIVSDAAVVDLVERGGMHWVELELYAVQRPIPVQRYVYDLYALLNFMRWIAGPEVQPNELEISHPASFKTDLYETAFKCSVRFECVRNAMGFQPAVLDLPLLTTNQAASELHEQFALQRMEQLKLENVSYRAREAIASRLPDGEPRRGDIALALRMSDRTLLRKLQDEGLSFNQLLDSTRRDLAQRYLRKKSVSLAQVAYLLGFADQSNFFRAFKRWFNTSPTRYRETL